MTIGELIGALAEYSLEADVSFHFDAGEEMEAEILSIYSENEDRTDKYVFIDMEIIDEEEDDDD